MGARERRTPAATLYSEAEEVVTGGRFWRCGRDVLGSGVLVFRAVAAIA